MDAPTLGAIRPFLDRIARYSVCMQETGEYENYRFLSDVPEEYDSLYLYGIGLIETEFYEHGCFDDDPLDDPSGIVVMNEETPYRSNLKFRPAIELMLSREPRESVLGVSHF